MTIDSRKVDVGQEGSLSSIEMTGRFLALCDRYGSDRGAVAVVARARRAGVSGLPERDDCTQWNVAEMRSAVDYLQDSTAMAESGPLRRPLR